MPRVLTKRKFVFVLAIVILIAVVLLEVSLLTVTWNRHEVLNNKVYRSTFLPPYWGFDLYKSSDRLSLPFQAERDSSVRRRCRAQIASGLREMGKQRVVFCGIARNIKLPILRKNIERIEACGAHFRDYRVVLFENDSDNGTRAELLAWEKRNSRVHLIKLGMGTCDEDDCKFKHATGYELGFTSHHRMNLMASFRNYYLDHVRSNYSDFDTMCVMDLDMHGGWSHEGLATTFAYPKEWDMVCCNGLVSVPVFYNSNLMHYDALAYVNSEASLQDIKSRSNIRMQSMSQYFSSINADISKVARANYAKNRYMLPVRSGFCGFSCYKIDPFVKHPHINYTASEDMQGICEHIVLHEKLRNAGHDRLYMNLKHVLLAGQQGPTLTQWFK